VKGGAAHSPGTCRSKGGATGSCGKLLKGVSAVWQLDLVKLTPLINRTRGQSQIAIALVGGPLWLAHPDLADQKIRQVSESAGAACSQPVSTACMHGTHSWHLVCEERFRCPSSGIQTLWRLRKTRCRAQPVDALLALGSESGPTQTPRGGRVLWNKPRCMNRQQSSL